MTKKKKKVAQPEPEPVLDLPTLLGQLTDQQVSLIGWEVLADLADCLAGLGQYKLLARVLDINEKAWDSPTELLSPTLTPPVMEWMRQGNKDALDVVLQITDEKRAAAAANAPDLMDTLIGDLAVAEQGGNVDGDDDEEWAEPGDWKLHADDADWKQEPAKPTPQSASLPQELIDASLEIKHLIEDANNGEWLLALLKPLVTERPGGFDKEKLTNVMDHAFGRTLGDLVFNSQTLEIDKAVPTEEQKMKSGRLITLLSTVQKLKPSWLTRLDSLWQGSKPTTSAPLPPAPPCHTGVVTVFKMGEMGGLTVTGGGNHTGDWKHMTPPPDLVVGPDSIVGEPREVGLFKGWKIGAYWPQTTVVGLDWPDFGAPHMPPEFWHALWADIRSRKLKRVHCQCMGGHGRTGTALCILLGLASPGVYTTVDELVQKVRSIYCQKAVESESQLKYIGKVLGIPYNGDTKGSKASYSYPTSTSMGMGTSAGTGVATAYTPPASQVGMPGMAGTLFSQGTTPSMTGGKPGLTEVK